MKDYYVYMMTNRSRVVLYTGVTNSLERRLWFHRSVSPRSFTKKYRVDRLVYYETFRNPRDAISREKEIKGWRREKKNDLVRSEEHTSELQSRFDLVCRLLLEKKKNK